MGSIQDQPQTSNKEKKGGGNGSYWMENWSEQEVEENTFGSRVL